MTCAGSTAARRRDIDEKCLKLALEVVPKFTPLKAEEAAAIKQQARTAGPIFRYPRDGKG